jgi:hypothetical protein
MTYQTLLWSDRWTCNCAAADLPAPDRRISHYVARQEALTHVALATTRHTLKEMPDGRNR